VGANRLSGFAGLGRALRAETDVAFGIIGHATASALVSYMEAGSRFSSARHENAAVNMADGWARMTREVGLASVTVGPGLTQIATALVTASRGGTPLVVFVGDLPWSDPARHPSRPRVALSALDGAAPLVGVGGPGVGRHSFRRDADLLREQELGDLRHRRLRRHGR
jgi:hypothetical protein